MLRCLGVDRPVNLYRRAPVVGKRRVVGAAAHFETFSRTSSYYIFDLCPALRQCTHAFPALNTSEPYRELVLEIRLKH